MNREELTPLELKKLNSNKALITLLSREPINVDRALRYIDYERKLKKLQTEMIKLQTWAIDNDERIVVIFEGRDAAGKGGAIRRITERINPRHMRIVALPKPSEDEQTQWYFQRYVQQLPKAGEIVFFNRSWYNRAVVEPVNDFCTQEEYEIFMTQVNDFERMLLDSGIHLVKVYMSISKKEQAKRFDEIKNDPLKQWKMSPVDEKAQELWEKYTEYKNAMFEKTNTSNSPWKIIKANRKTDARVNALNHLLKRIPYDKDIEI
ncbi:polyphosphate kinase 2 [Pseudotenacibaculum haliotis]|uniref:ADP/GDP-polyphosphate phosphotransferase n=1 Tax=Pseudotenacibaculum haliotis TaxID=1862138 RepID=A0ABW5LUG2_9FLAO